MAAGEGGGPKEPLLGSATGLIQQSSDTEHRGPRGGQRKRTRGVSGKAGPQRGLTPARGPGHPVGGG